MPAGWRRPWRGALLQGRRGLLTPFFLVVLSGSGWVQYSLKTSECPCWTETPDTKTWQVHVANGLTWDLVGTRDPCHKLGGSY